VFYTDGTGNSKGVFWGVGALVCAKAYERKREGPWLAFGSCFLGSGKSHVPLPTMPTHKTNYAYSYKKRQRCLCFFAAGDLVDVKGRQERRELQLTAFGSFVFVVCGKRGKEAPMPLH